MNKTVKRTTTRKALKLRKRKTNNITTVHGLVHRNDIKNMLTPGESVLVNSCKEHQNHSINSFLAHTGTEGMMNEMVMVKLEIIGKPLVKTTRQITIKK